MAKTTARISPSGKRAEVKIDSRSLFVEASAEETKEYFSPAELIVSALGG